MSCFEFNHHGECINPERVILAGGIEVRLACHDGQWGSHYSIALSRTGQYGPIFARDCTHPTRDDAYADAATRLAERLATHPSYQDEADRPRVKAALAACNSRQRELF